MASFVEQAVLKVSDQSSGPINKINAELRKLQQTARSLKGMSANLNLKDTGIAKATADIRRLESELRRLRAVGAVNIAPQVNIAPTTAVQSFHRVV